MQDIEVGMKEKKKKVKVKEDENGITITFAPADSFVIPTSIRINFGGEKDADTFTKRQGKEK